MKSKNISNQAVEFILSRSIGQLKRLTGKEIASVIGIDIKSLESSFKNEQKISLQAFILREKIFRAFSILTGDSSKSIDELAEELGFLGVEEFSIEFEKHLAIAPGKYRDLRKTSMIPK